MGTSSSYGGAGPGNPLIPSWLEGGGAPPGPPEAPPDGRPTAPEPHATTPGGRNGNGPQHGSGVAAGGRQPAGAVPLGGVATGTVDFGAARSNFSRFAGSNGVSRRALGRAVASHVRSAGGGARAASRMGSSRAAGAAIAGFVGDAARHGLIEALRTLNLANLAGRPLVEIFGALIDVMCPEGGTIDEGIARDAFVEAMVELTERGVERVEDLGADGMSEFFENFVTHSIEGRLENDIAMRAVTLPTDTAAAQRVQDILRDFTRRAVRDAVANAGDLQNVAPEGVAAWVDIVYAQSFELLRAYGEEEAE
jgi:hypothetical protein